MEWRPRPSHGIGFSPHSWRVSRHACFTTGIRKLIPCGRARMSFRWLGYSPRAAISEVLDCVTSLAKQILWDLCMDQYCR